MTRTLPETYRRYPTGLKLQYAAGSLDRTVWNSRKVCAVSLLNLCRKAHLARLASSEVAIIRAAANDKAYLHWPLSLIYYHLMRDGKLHCSMSTFYKYCRLLGVTRPKHSGRKQRESLKATTPLSMLHMDITLFKTADGVKHYLYVIRDKSAGRCWHVRLRWNTAAGWQRRFCMMCFANTDYSNRKDN